MLKIGMMANIVGLNVESLRYYERLGLITSERDPINRYRLYDKEKTLEEIKFIKNASSLGFSLEEIAFLIKVKNTRTRVHTLLNPDFFIKLNSLEDKINELIECKKIILDTFEKGLLKLEREKLKEK